MDSRVALQNGTVLRLTNKDGGAILYTIHSEIGRGSSCIVYDATYETNAGSTKHVRIKECYPYRLAIKREENGQLIPSKNDADMYEKVQEKVWDDFVLSNKLFYCHKLADSFVNTFDIYNENNTTYVVSAFSSKDTLSEYRPVNILSCISLVQQVALAIKDIHKEGYLYLDIKPENVLVVQGHYNRVMLFDFDSLIPISATLSKCQEISSDIRLSYTQGFASVELQMGKLNRLGTYTDVYGIGALLFYLLFGRAPSALDCDQTVDFENNELLYEIDNYDDKLHFALQEFFQKTLANYYMDRIQDMSEVVGLLGNMMAYADDTIPFIHSSHITRPAMCLGRNGISCKINDWLLEQEKRCLFVYGIGGIGKSTLVRELICSHKNDYDTILYLQYNQNLKLTLTNDYTLRINTVHKNDVETLEDYYIRKLKSIKSLVHNKKVLLVIDNYNGENANELSEIMDINWKVLIVSRQPSRNIAFTSIEIPRIMEKELLIAIYEHNSRRLLLDSELRIFDELINIVSGHTLLIELIAKQVANSYISLEQAVTTIKNAGISNVGQEEIAYSKDFSTEYKTIREVISALVEGEKLSVEKRAIIKAISLIGEMSIGICDLCDALCIENKTSINELISEGWITRENQELSLHPVISEAASLWSYTSEARDCSVLLIKYLVKQIKNMEKRTSPQFLVLVENVILHCTRDNELKDSSSVRELICSCVLSCPRYREDLILKYGTEIIQNELYFDEKMPLQVLARMVEVYEEHKEFESANELMNIAVVIIGQSKNSLLRAYYFDMLSEFYDHALGGAYITFEKQEKEILNNMFRATDKAIYYATKSGKPGREVLVKNLLGKATFLIRSAPNKRRQIGKLINKAKNIIAEEFSPKAPIYAHYYMVCSWLFTIAIPNREEAVAYMDKAKKIPLPSEKTDLDEIDERIIPCANIHFYWRDYEQAIELLESGIQVCSSNDSITPYIRKELELYNCLIDVLAEIGNAERIDKVKVCISQLEQKIALNERFRSVAG